MQIQPCARYSPANGKRDPPLSHQTSASWSDDFIRLTGALLALHYLAGNSRAQSPKYVTFSREVSIINLERRRPVATKIRSWRAAWIIGRNVSLDSRRPDARKIWAPFDALGTTDPANMCHLFFLFLLSITSSRFIMLISIAFRP